MKLILMMVMYTILCIGNAWALEGYATYYTIESCLREGNTGITASGEQFDESKLTCALRSRRFGRHYVVYSPATGKSVVVRHNDFGPGKGPLNRGVSIDLSPTAFKAVCGDLKQGKCLVNIQEVEE